MLHPYEEPKLGCSTEKIEREAIKVKHPGGFKPTPSWLRGACSTAVLQPTNTYFQIFAHLQVFKPRVLREVPKFDPSQVLQLGHLLVQLERKLALQEPELDRVQVGQTLHADGLHGGDGAERKYELADLVTSAAEKVLGCLRLPAWEEKKS